MSAGLVHSLILMNDGSLWGCGNKGTESRFPDVNSAHPVYNAICNAVDKNSMNASITGEFEIDKSVSDSDALLVIRSLKDLNKIK